MFYFYLNTEIIISPPMRFDLAKCLGRSDKMGFLMWYVPCLTKLPFDAFVYSSLGLYYLIDVLSDRK